MQIFKWAALLCASVAAMPAQAAAGWPPTKSGIDCAATYVFFAFAEENEASAEAIEFERKGRLWLTLAVMHPDSAKEDTVLEEYEKSVDILADKIESSSDEVLRDFFADRASRCAALESRFQSKLDEIANLIEENSEE